jgi:hypothetical protein
MIILLPSVRMLTFNRRMHGLILFAQASTNTRCGDRNNFMSSILTRRVGGHSEQRRSMLPIMSPSLIFEDHSTRRQSSHQTLISAGRAADDGDQQPELSLACRRGRNHACLNLRRVLIDPAILHPEALPRSLSGTAPRSSRG